MENRRNNELNLTVLFGIFKTRWLVLLIAGLLVAVLTFGYSKFFLTPQYRASAQLFVDTRKVSADQAQAETFISSNQIAAAKELAKSYTHIIKTNSVLNAVIDELDLKISYSKLASMISVKVVEDTQILVVSAVEENPKVALNIVSKIIELTPSIINEKIQSSKLISIDEPTVTGSPVSPNVLSNTIIGFVAGAIIVYVFYFIRQLLDNKFKSAEDIGKILDLPVLGVIPKLGSVGSK